MSLNGTFGYDTAVIRKCADSAENDIKKIKEGLTNMETILENVKAAWSGAVASSFYNQAVQKKADMVEIIGLLNTLPDEMRKIATTIENAGKGSTSA